MNNKIKNKIVCVLFAVFLILGFTLGSFMPKAEFSASERRKLAKKPVLNSENILSGKYMTDFEKYTVDTFPFRDNWREIKALWAKNVFLNKDNNGVYLHDNYLAAMDYPYNPASVDRAVSRFQFVIDKYLNENNNVYVSIIPDKNYFLAEPSGHLSYDYDELVEQFVNGMSGTKYIDVFDKLSIEDYYLTDTHWKQDKIVPVAQTLLEGMGIEFENNFEVKETEKPFYGVYYGQAALPVEPDELNYLVNGKIEDYTVFDYQNNKEIPMYNLDKVTDKDPYEMFVGGPISLVTITNENAETDKELIVFRDSFGSSIAPLLSSGYSKVTLVDIRYLQPERLGSFIDFENSDVLFLYSSFVINNSEILK